MPCAWMLGTVTSFFGPGARLNALLNGPLFMPGEMPFRGSIEDGYVVIARFVSEHPEPWG